MSFGKKYDYPPLLAPGRHRISLPAVKAMVVDGFPGNQRRRDLFYRFEGFVQEILVADIPCEVWLDGSLLTEKDEPGDLDVTIILEPDVFEALKCRRLALIEKIQDGAYADGIDSWVFVRKRRDDPKFGDPSEDPAHSWGEQYGLECSEQWLKGFVVVRLRETDVGLRICS